MLCLNCEEAEPGTVGPMSVLSPRPEHSAGTEAHTVPMAMGGLRTDEVFGLGGNKESNGLLQVSHNIPIAGHLAIALCF